MAIACLLILLQIELGEVFLLTNSTNAGLKSYEFQHLSRLIFNEEQSRHHIAKEVDNIEYRMSKLEDGLNAIFKKFTNTVDQLRSSTASLEQRLEQQTKSSDYIRHLFEKEKLNRQQLEHEYSDLEMKFQNLSLSCGVLQNRTDYLEKVLNNGKKKIATHAAYITSNSATMAEVLSNLTTVERGIWSAIAELSQRTADTSKSAFFVFNPKSLSSFGKIIFQSEKLNLGGHFNTTNGKFTCFHPGTYFFIVNLYKSLTNMKTYCDINMNGSAVLWVDARQHSSATDNFQEASNSVGIHLNQGDVNDLRCSSDNNTFDFMTSFMGFLLYPVD